VVAVSFSLYRSAPVEADGPDFINAVAAMSTQLWRRRRCSPRCRPSNSMQGRERPYHHAPRTLDLDLLLYGSLAHDADRRRALHAAAPAHAPARLRAGAAGRHRARPGDRRSNSRRPKAIELALRLRPVPALLKRPRSNRRGRVRGHACSRPVVRARQARGRDRAVTAIGGGSATCCGHPIFWIRDTRYLQVIRERGGHDLRPPL
jgi:hypothetical protein